jgi:hypothetical protein
MTPAARRKEKCETEHNSKCCGLEVVCKKSLTESGWVRPSSLKGVDAKSEIHRARQLWYIAMTMFICTQLSLGIDLPVFLKFPHHTHTLVIDFSH